MSKTAKYTILALIIGVIGYNSVYFKKLSERKAAQKSFDAAAYAKDLFEHRLPPVLAKSISFDELLASITSSPDLSFKQYGHSLTIGSSKFFMVKGKGKIEKIDESSVTLRTPANNVFKISTEFVFGNDIRDAYGLIKLNDFTNTIDLSNISAEINKIVRTKVIPPFRNAVKEGDEVAFIGAIELNKVHLNLSDIELSPVSLAINP